MSDGGMHLRDEPNRGANGHAELLSELDSHDIAVATNLVASPDTDVFDVDESPTQTRR